MRDWMGFKGLLKALDFGIDLRFEVLRARSEWNGDAEEECYEQ